MAREVERRRAKDRGEDRVPKSYVAFCSWLGVSLEPGQLVIAKVAYDGMEPIDLPVDEREIAREIFGDVDRIPKGARDVIVAICGGRGGKTYVVVALRVLHLALTVSLATLAPGEVASAPIIAPDKDLAGQALHYIQGAVASKPELMAMVIGKVDAAESVELRRENGRSVEICVKAASARGRTGRGKSLVCAVMDEAAFFYDASYHVNDEEIYKGLAPRIMPGGQLIIDSTPWAQVGLLFELFAANHPNPERAGLPPRPQCDGTALALHASTTRLRDNEFTRDIVAREEKRDAANAAREFGAIFMDAGAATFFEPACIEACLPEIPLELPLPPAKGVIVKAGGDVGLTKNSSALCIGHTRGDMTTVAELIEDKPEKGKPFAPSFIAKKYVAKIVEHGGSYFMADGHYREVIVEHAAPVGLGVIDAPMAPADAFIAVRGRMREGKLRIPNNPRFIRQLRETVSRAGSGGNITISLPKWKTGEHGDLVSAFVLMAFQTSGITVANNDKPKYGTPEWFRQEDERQVQKDLDNRDRDRREEELLYG